MHSIEELYNFPFRFRDYQVDCLNAISIHNRKGYFLAPGLGKTIVATADALYQVYCGEADHVLVICPPILVLQWCKWLEQVGDLNGGFNITDYRGTPAVRKKKNFNGDFTCMSIQIFKRDYKRIKEEFKNKSVVIIVDEAHSIRNVGTKNYRAVRDMAIGNSLILLTGTPIGNPIHGYAICKLLTPDVYRSIKQFKNIHVVEEDFWGAPKEYQNLDLLQENLSYKSVFLEASDVLNLPEIIYQPIVYDLTASHMKLYNKLLDEEILVTEDEVIDATQATRMYHQCQQLVMNPAHFSDGVVADPQGLDLINETVEELAGEKLLIYCNYRMTNKLVTKYLKEKGVNAVSVYGGNTQNQNQNNIAAFMTDPNCQILVANPKSAGEGLDGMQGICRYILFLECPITPNVFTQAIARIHRLGQEFSCVVKIAIADQTVQATIARRVTEKDEVLQEVVTSKENISKALKGII